MGCGYSIEGEPPKQVSISKFVKIVQNRENRNVYVAIGYHVSYTWNGNKLTRSFYDSCYEDEEDYGVANCKIDQDPVLSSYEPDYVFSAKTPRVVIPVHFYKDKIYLGQTLWIKDKCQTLWIQDD